MVDIDPKLCPICAAPMRITHSEPYGELRRRYRRCPECKRRDKVLVRIRAEVVISVTALCEHNEGQPEADANALD